MRSGQAVNWILIAGKASGETVSWLEWIRRWIHFVKAAALYPAEAENVKIPDARVVQADGHAEITYWDKYGNEHRVRLAVSMPGHLIILEGFRQYASLCIRNNGPEALIVDSGLHYFVRIEPGRVREIQPENAMYR